MSCTNTAYDARVIGSTLPRVRESTLPRVWSAWRALKKTIIAMHEAFQEALEMRRAAHRNYPFDDE